MDFKRNNDRVITAMIRQVTELVPRRSVVVLAAGYTSLESETSAIYARYLKRSRVVELVEHGHLQMIGVNAACWTEEGILIYRTKRRGRSPLDFHLMDWDLIEISEPIDRTARLVTIQAQVVSLSAA
jgi:hypothetical protein